MLVSLLGSLAVNQRKAEWPPGRTQSGGRAAGLCVTWRDGTVCPLAGRSQWRGRGNTQQPALVWVPQEGSALLRAWGMGVGEERVGSEGTAASEVWSRALVSSMKPWAGKLQDSAWHKVGLRITFVKLKWGDCCEPSMGHRQWQISPSSSADGDFRDR